MATAVHEKNTHVHQKNIPPSSWRLLQGNKEKTRNPLDKGLKRV